MPLRTAVSYLCSPNGYTGFERPLTFDVTKYRQGVIVVLDQRTLKPALPHVAGRALQAVIAPGVSDRQRLQNATDGLTQLRSEQQVALVAFP
jgi:hypothetical protein